MRRHVDECTKLECYDANSKLVHVGGGKVCVCVQMCGMCVVE